MHDPTVASLTLMPQRFVVVALETKIFILQNKCFCLESVSNFAKFDVLGILY